MSVFILQNVYKYYVINKKEHVVLRDINITFPDKGFVSIVGKSGSGKSTLLNLLSGIEKPSKGKIFFKRKDISKYNDRACSLFHLNGIGVVFQHYNLFDELTAFDNVALPLKMKGKTKKSIKKKVEALFEEFNLSNLINRKVKNLSGGEKQRIAILRSLITEPKVILCDEPTGALDDKNSQEILRILRKIAQDKLIVMVSHNNNLVNQFSDHIIEIKDGKIVNNSIKPSTKFSNSENIKKTKYRHNWINLFLKHNLRKNLGKNLFSFFACVVGFASVFVCVGFLNGSEKSYEEAITKTLSIGTTTVSKIESIVISDSPLTYQKTIRPDISDIDKEFEGFTTIRYEENLSFFISNNTTCSYSGTVFSNFQMVPTIDLSLKTYGRDLLVEGKPGNNNFDEVLVNKEFEELLGGNVLNKNIVLKNNCTVNYKTYDEEFPFIKDEFILEKPLKIVGILNEFPFLNSPKIYYSYYGARSFLKSQTMDNLSFYLGYGYSYFDYLCECKADDPVSSYSSYLFLTNMNEKDSFFSKIKKLNDKTLEVTSTALEIKDTYETFISSFSKTLFIFSIVVFIGINFILGMISLSSFLSERKNTAILTCLGSRNGSIYRLHLFENYFVILLAFIVSIFTSLLLEKLLNPFLASKFALETLIEIPMFSYFGIPFGLILIFALIALITATIFTVTPMLFYRHGFLVEELRDE